MRDMIVAALLLALWTVAVLARYWNVPALDMTGLYFASALYHQGDVALVYSDLADRFLWRDAPDAWKALAEANGYPTDQLTDYVYPPLWVALFGPVADGVSPLAFFNAGRALTLAVFALGIIAAWDMAERPVTLPIWAAISLVLIELTSFGYLALDLAQPQFLVVGVLLIGFALYRRGMSVTGGGAIALIAAIKLTPAVFALIFVADRNWRALTGFVVVGGGLATLSVALTGWPLHAEFLDRMSLLGEAALFSHINASVAAFANLLSDPPGVDDPWAIFGHAWSESRPLANAIGTLFSIAGLAAAFIVRRRQADGFGLCLTVALISLVSLLGSPLGWLHYLIVLAALGPAIFSWLQPKTATIALVALGLAFNEAFFDGLLAQHVHKSMIYNVTVTLILTLALFAVGLTRRSPSESAPEA